MLLGSVRLSCSEPKNINAGCVSFSINEKNSPVLWASSGTTIAPIKTDPKKAATHSGRLSPHIMTLSPLVTPLLVKYEATWVELFHNS